MESNKHKACFIPHPAPWLEAQRQLLETRRRVNDETAGYYERLNILDREDILGWLNENFDQLPFPLKLKTLGLQKLREGDYRFPPALLLIRQAVKAVRTETTDV